MNDFEDYLEVGGGVLVAIFFIVAIYRFFRGWRQSNALGHWNHQVDDFQFSSHEFYNKLESALKTSKIEGLETKTVYHHEGIWFVSPKRMYLRVIWKGKIIDICAASFGKGFFFSWWLFEKIMLWEIIIMSFPIIGNLLVNFFNPMTFYRIDTASMFQSYVHTYVLNLIDEITKENNIQGLTEAQRKPMLNDIFKRK